MVKAIKMIKEFLVLLLLMHSTSLLAEYDAGFGGWTEIIACPTSSWDSSALFHEPFYWGGSGPNISYISPPGWWTYGDAADAAFNCKSWVNGSLVGGASYEPGEASMPQGVNVRINTNWWDFIKTDFSTTCGHQHVSTYVWGWRRNANTWSFEFITAHTLTSFLNAEGECLFQGVGNPNYTHELLEGYAFGDQTLLIENSPYAVLYTKSQANSHFYAGCGGQECLHPVRVAVTYEGGPGVKQGKVEMERPTQNLAMEAKQDENQPQVNPLAVGALNTGNSVSLRPGWKELARTAKQHMALNHHRISDSKQSLDLDQITIETALQSNPLLACEISYIQTSAAMTNQSAQFDRASFPRLKMASYDVFINDCLNMPRQIQKCQVFEYIKTHYGDCREARKRHNAQLKMQASVRYP